MCAPETTQNSLRHKIDAASRANDFAGVVTLFRESRDQERPLEVHSCNVLLHMCSQQPPSAADAPAADTPDGFAQEVFDYMLQRGVAPVEMTYTALSRVAARGNDGAKAYEWVQKMRAAGITPKLRSFVPALNAYCASGDVQGADTILNEIDAAKLSLTETEYCALIRAYTEDPGAAEAGWALLRRIAGDLRLVGEELLAAASDFFGAQGWSTELCTVDDAGVCSATPAVVLQPVDLSPEEANELAEGIAALARARERVEDFDAFVAWLAEAGPRAWVVDGANVGMFNQSYEGAQFQFSQLERLLAHLRAPSEAEAEKAELAAAEAAAAAAVAAVEAGLEPPPVVMPPPPPPEVLLVLHHHRVTAGPARSANAKAIIAEWTARGELHVTPVGSNDDWYWLYAAVRAGPQGRLVTNDELRDHVFQMLPAPRLFYKWKERHQVRFNLSGGGCVLEHPTPFTTCIQHGNNNGWWMLPHHDAVTWTLARAPGV